MSLERKLSLSEEKSRDSLTKLEELLLKYETEKTRAGQAFSQHSFISPTPVPAPQSYTYFPRLFIDEQQIQQYLSQERLERERIALLQAAYQINLYVRLQTLTAPTSFYMGNPQLPQTQTYIPPISTPIAAPDPISLPIVPAETSSSLRVTPVTTQESAPTNRRKRKKRQNPVKHTTREFKIQAQLSQTDTQAILGKQSYGEFYSYQLTVILENLDQKKFTSIKEARYNRFVSPLATINSKYLNNVTIEEGLVTFKNKISLRRLDCVLVLGHIYDTNEIIFLGEILKKSTHKSRADHKSEVINYILVNADNNTRTIIWSKPSVNVSQVTPQPSAIQPPASEAKPDVESTSSDSFDLSFPGSPLPDLPQTPLSETGPTLDQPHQTIRIASPTQTPFSFFQQRAYVGDQDNNPSFDLPEKPDLS